MAHLNAAPSSFRLLALAAIFVTSSAFAEVHTAGVPVMSSRPGATYTVFLDPAGFAFNGQWGGGSTPGTNPALNGTTGTFNATDIAEIKAIYGAMANQYRSFNVNVTTVDPAIAALGAGATDAQRQDYYDSQAHMMHTVIGVGGQPNPTWHGSADGLAIAGIDHVVTQGIHTNWMFTEAQESNGDGPLVNGNYIGNISSHETGHTFGLAHQADYTGTTKINEYGFGDTANGNGNYVATMGNASDRQRVAWRAGTASGGSFQNDVKVIGANDGVSFVDSGIGHTFGTATPVPLLGGSINVNAATHKGQINPKDLVNPVALGVDNYTKDFFSFQSNGTTPITLTLNDGNDFITPGVADNGITLRSILTIFDAGQNPVMVVPESADTLSSSLINTVLGAGKYFAQVTSFGGHAENSGFEAASYFDMGGYFLTGSGFVVPEPTSMLFIAMAAYGVMGRRRAQIA